MNKLDWIKTDITFCYNVCDNMKCYRNVKHLDGYEGYFSMSMLKDTDLCPSYDEDGCECERQETKSEAN